LLCHPLAARLPLTLLGLDRTLDLHPVVRVVGVDDQQRQLRTLADPLALRAVGGGVDQDLVALVIEPHGRQPDPAVGPDQTENDCDRPVEQRLVDRVELREALDRRPLTDGELTRLQSVRDVFELRNGDLTHWQLLCEWMIYPTEPPDERLATVPPTCGPNVALASWPAFEKAATSLDGGCKSKAPC